MPDDTVAPPVPVTGPAPTGPAAPAPAPAPEGAATPGAAAGPARSVRVMALLIAFLCGTVGALSVFILFRHLGAGALVALGSSGAAFLGVSGAVKVFEEKLGVL